MTVLLGAVLAALLTPSLRAWAQAAPDTTHQDALWLGTVDRLVKINTSGQIAVSIPNTGKILSVVLDERRGTTWAYARQVLTGYDFAGVRKVQVTGLAPLPLDIDDISLAVPPAPNPNDGSVWVGAGQNLYHVFPDGRVAGPVVLADKVKSLKVDDARGRLWVALRNQVALLNLADAAPLLPALTVTGVKDLALDEATGDAWVVTATSLKRFNAALTQQFSSDLDVSPKNVSTHGSSLWVAGMRVVVRFDASGVEQARYVPFPNADGASDEIEALDAAHDDVTAWVVSVHNKLAPVGPAGVGAVLDPFPGAVADYIEQVRLYTDFLAPQLAITTPLEGQTVTETHPQIGLIWSDIGQGVNPATLAVRINGLSLPVTCTHVTGASTCTPDNPLETGITTVSATVADYRGNVSAPALVSFTVNGDTIPPIITVLQPPSGTVTNTAAQVLSGFVSESATLSINGIAVPLGMQFDFTFPVTLVEGVNTFALSATDTAGNVGTASYAITLDTVAPVVTIIAPSNGLVTNVAAQTLTGTVSETATVSVSGTAVTPGTGNIFSHAVTLVEGVNTLTVAATDVAGNVGTATVGVTLDTAAPVITVTAPADGLLTRIALQQLTGTVSEGVQLTVSGAPVALDVTRAFAYDVLLTEGINTLTLSATDVAGNVGTATHRLELDSTPPVVTPPAALTVEATALLTPVNPGVGSALDSRDGALVPTHDAPAGLPPGATTVTWSATDAAGNTGTATQTVTVRDTTPPVLTVPPAVTVTVNVAPAAVSIGQATATDLFGPVTVTSNAPASYPEGLTTVTWTATDAHGNVTTGTQTIIVTLVQAAKALNPNGYGKMYESLVPLDATVAAYDEKRFSIVTGFVQDLAGNPLVEARATINNNSDYGSSVTDATGRYSIPVNGGGLITVTIEKSGYNMVQRKVQTSWNQINMVKPVVLAPLDTKATVITFDGDPTSRFTHQSSPTNNADGTRTTTLVFTGDTQVSVKDLHTGIVTPLTGPITVRATEMPTVEALPGELPPTTAFTYASRLSVDGIGNFSSIQFSKTVVLWVDNFRNIPVGGVPVTSTTGIRVPSLVPVGHYNPISAAWEPEPNGLVVRLLDTDGDGVVDALDAEDDGVPNDLNGDGAFSDEVAGTVGIAGFVPGASFWRVERTSFSAIDLNWAFKLVANILDSIPNILHLPGFNSSENCSPGGKASVIICEAGRLDQDIPIPGTGLLLHYKSSRAPGFSTGISVTRSGGTTSTLIQGTETTVSIAGHLFKKSEIPNANEEWQLPWDGTDLLGKPASGEVSVQSSNVQQYQLECGVFLYDAAGRISGASFSGVGSAVPSLFGVPTGAASGMGGSAGGSGSGSGSGYATVSISREGGQCGTGGVTGVASAMILMRPDRREETEQAATARDGGSPVAAAWSLDDHHRLIRGIYLLRGDGDEGGNLAPNIINSFAGPNTATGSDEGLPVRQAKLFLPRGVAVAPDGSVYLADSGHHRVVHFTPQGTVHTVAGYFNGTSYTGGYNGDNIPATQAALYNPHDLEIGSDGSLYIVDSSNFRIRRITPDGVIHTIAGNGIRGFSGDGGAAVGAQIGDVGGIGVGPDGAVYIADRSNRRVRAVTISGMIYTVAGNGIPGPTVDGAAAADTFLQQPSDVAIDLRGNLFVTDNDSYSNGFVYKIRPDGILNMFAGKGTNSSSSNPYGDNGPALGARFSNAYSVKAAADGSVYVVDVNVGLVRRVSSDGWITTVAGKNAADAPTTGDLVPATEVRIAAVTGLGIAPDNTLYLSHYTASGSDSSVKVVFPGTMRTQTVTMPDGSQVVEDAARHEKYVFDANGRHLHTLDLETGRPLRGFGYTDGKLTAITDRFGNTVSIARSGGVPTVIADPFGRATALNVTGSDLTAVTYADGSGYQFGYLSDTSLMTSKTDPTGAVTTY
ncbi:MAG: HYR domain-containing protein, partial [Deltaproteobacteria bacterium]|nr:HYR domain-containing protein [Deltaproteobacteria bacterium]